MAERRAQQKYYPPEWDPSMGMLNKFHGTHHLRERASKLKTEGIMVIRFELPWNIWCGGCEAHIRKGRRYNADKKAVGKYFSTTIYDFKFNCQHCSQEIHMQTDPEHRDYKVVSGARRKVEDWNPENDMHETLLADDERQEMRADPFKRLEHLQKDKEAVVEKKDQFDDLIDLKERISRDDYSMNRQLRQSFRTVKKELKASEAEGVQKGLVLPLLPASSDDARAAASTSLATKTASLQDYRKQQRRRIQSSSIFGSQYKAPSTTAAHVLGKVIQRGVDPKLFNRQRGGATPAATRSSSNSTLSANLKKRAEQGPVFVKSTTMYPS